jgi:hypothetical protein
MEPAGWLLLVTSWVALSSLVLYCLRSILRDGRGRGGEED